MDQPAYYEQGQALTKQYEGFRSDPYKDTQGIPTIGYGFNMQANPGLPSHMDQATADQYFNNYYQQASNTAKKFAGQQWGDLTDGQKAVLTDMAYNLHNKLFGFKNMQQDLQQGDNEGVQKEMKNSNWYGQVGNRGRQDVAQWSGT